MRKSRSQRRNHELDDRFATRGSTHNRRLCAGVPASVFSCSILHLRARHSELWPTAIDRPPGRHMIADLVGSERVRRHSHLRA
jgi:hypothetical protein